MVLLFDMWCTCTKWALVQERFRVLYRVISGQVIVMMLIWISHSVLMFHWILLDLPPNKRCKSWSLWSQGYKLLQRHLWLLWPSVHSLKTWMNKKTLQDLNELPLFPKGPYKDTVMLCTLAVASCTGCHLRAHYISLHTIAIIWLDSKCIVTGHREVMLLKNFLTFKDLFFDLPRIQYWPMVICCGLLACILDGWSSTLQCSQWCAM